MICAWYGSMARMIWLVSDRRLDAVLFLDLEVAQDRRARVAHVALIVGVHLEEAVGALDDLDRRAPRASPSSATSVTRLMAMPGAISTNSEAWPGTGRNPRAVLPMKLASCGCRASRNV